MNSSERLQVAVFVPGLQGGVDEAARHLFGPGTSGDCDVTVFQTKGLSSAKAPLVFAKVLATVVWLRMRGRLDGAHLNMSFKGSTLRKTIIGLLLILLRVPYVVQIHSGGYQDFWEGLGQRPRNIIGFMLRRAKKVIMLGNHFREFAIDGFGLDPNRVEVIPNGVPATPTLAAHAVRKLGSQHVLYLGRLHHDKGTYELVTALGKLKDLDWSATLAGNDEVEATRAAVRRNGLDDRITVLDWVNREETLGLLEKASVFVLASRSEAMSMSLLEAMGHGLACIATPVGTHGDFLVDNENAYVIAPGQTDQLEDALRTVLSDDATRERLARNAKELVATTFEASRVRSRHETIFRREFGYRRESGHQRE